MADQPSILGELAAMGRQGANDLFNAIVPAFPDSMQGVDQPGTPMSPTQMMVNEDLGVSAQAEAPSVEAPQSAATMIEAPQAEAQAVEAPQAEASSQIEAPQPSYEQALDSAAMAPPAMEMQQEMQMEM